MAEEAEVINLNVVTINDNGKNFELITKCTDPEQLFLDEKNFVPMLDQLKVVSRGLIADVHTKDGIAQRKTLNSKLASLKNAIEDEGKKVAAALKAKPKIVDGTRKKVKDTIEMLQEEVMAPIKAIEARQEEIEQIALIPGSAIGCPVDGIKQYIEILEDHVHDEEYWDESFAQAIDTINEARKQLNSMLAEAEKAEAEKRELEELRAKQAEAERLLREKAEAEKREAEEKLRKAQEEAEAAKREAEDAKRKQAEAEAASGVMQGGIAKVKNDAEKTKAQMLFPDDKAEYRRMCNREALEDMVANSGITEDQAKAVITAIVKNKVRHIYMMY